MVGNFVFINITVFDSADMFFWTLIKRSYRLLKSRTGIDGHILAPIYTRHSYFYVRTVKRVSTTIGEKVLIIAFSILLHLYK